MDIDLNKLETELKQKDISNHHIGVAVDDTVIQTETIPQAVQKFLDSYKTVQEQTAKHCLDLAEWLEGQALDLRNKAAILNHQATQIPDDVSRSVSFEIETRRRAHFLATLGDMPK